MWPTIGIEHVLSIRTEQDILRALLLQHHRLPPNSCLQKHLRYLPKKHDNDGMANDAEHVTLSPALEVENARILHMAVGWITRTPLPRVPDATCFNKTCPFLQISMC